MNLQEKKGAVETFEFSGSAKEWFGIWIVNLLLSIITVGIYSAWAKVRTKKYFYGNTNINGRNFDYHATGGQILKGRLIVVAALVVLQVILATAPILGLFIFVGLIALYPWLVTRAMFFNARMSSFSNVRFDFVGTYGRAAMLYIVYPILCALTLYTTLPILDRAFKKFSINNHRIGTAEVHMDAPISAFYKAAGVALVWVVLVFVVASILGGVGLGGFAQAMAQVDSNPAAALPVIIAFYVIFFIGFVPAAFIYQALIRNVVYNGTFIEGGHRLSSNISAQKLFWIALSNMVVIVCTLGLMLPWAQVRMAKYLAAHTGVSGGSLDAFVDVQKEATSALGDAYTDIEGIDVGLPI